MTLTDAALRERAVRLWTEIQGWLEPILPSGWNEAGSDGWADYETCKAPSLDVLEVELIALRDAAYAEQRKSVDAILRKCEQYWNEDGLGDAEIHAILEFIHQHAAAIRAQEETHE